MFGVVAAVLILQAVVAEEICPLPKFNKYYPRFENRQFYIYNRKYPTQRLSYQEYAYNKAPEIQTMPFDFIGFLVGAAVGQPEPDWQHNPYVATTSTYNFNASQLWTLVPDARQRSCYYIKNFAHPNFRIANIRNEQGAPEWHTTNYIRSSNSTEALRDALWQFEFNDDETFFRICKCQTDICITKHGEGRFQLGTVRRRETARDEGAVYWRLVDRFRIRQGEDEIISIDNRQSKVSACYSVTTTKGMRSTTQKTATFTDQYKHSVSASAGAGVEGAGGVSAGFSTEDTNTLMSSTSSGHSHDHSSSDAVQYTMNAGENFKVVQKVFNIISRIPGDSSILRSKIKICRSATDDFPDCAL